MLTSDEPSGGMQVRESLDETLASPSEGSAGASYRPGSLIGPYQVLRTIGSGGMGIVYRAEQLYPVRRLVALKLIKPGMDSEYAVSRFEMERQTLASMEHVNIARVFDAGASSAGRLYFAMELVEGVPLTRFCDENAVDLQ